MEKVIYDCDGGALSFDDSAPPHPYHVDAQEPVDEEFEAASPGERAKPLPYVLRRLRHAGDNSGVGCPVAGGFLRRLCRGALTEVEARDGAQSSGHQATPIARS